jgi:hypothetical protein
MRKQLKPANTLKITSGIDAVGEPAYMLSCLRAAVDERHWPQSKEPQVSSKRRPEVSFNSPSPACHSPKADEYVCVLPDCGSLMKGPALEKGVWLQQDGKK